jgi:uncharacterized phage-associated protein
MHDARGIANFILDHADASRCPLTNLALLKHIYFCHGWHLAKHGTPLVKNRFEAWEHGPVIRAVYDAFKHHGAKPITTRSTSIDWSTGEITTVRPQLDTETQRLIESTFAYYSGYGAFELSELTHTSDGPWYAVWHRRDRQVVLNMEIKAEAIMQHFRQASAANLLH